MTTRASHLVCSGCGAAPARHDPYPFRCPNAGTGDVDHVLQRVLDVGRARFPTGDRPADEPFLRYRNLLHSYHRLIEAGLDDAAFAVLVGRLDDSIAAVDGHGFVATPFSRSPTVSDALGFSRRGGVWVKDETGNVSGSHKARHLMGVLLHLEVAELIGLASRHERPDLAIASCGNAALAAAVLACAAGRRLRVFVPTDADPVVLARLHDLRADVVTCPRVAGVPGDPTYARLHEELSAGALAFTCQGSENGLVIEGGETLGYEIVSAMRARGVTLDHVVVQVGGGALASACMQAFGEAVALGAIPHGPRMHTVQTASGHPLERAYRNVRALLPETAGPADIEGALRIAAVHRSSYMWPWETEPKSIATGILDDETYDWQAVVGGMLATGGVPLVVTEERLAEAHRLGHLAGYPVEPTGSSGLAGLLDLVADGVVGPDDTVAVLFTGVDR